MASKKNFELKPVAYPKTASPAKASLKRRSVVAIGNADRRVDSPAPESQSPQLTGHYEQDDSLATLQVNQTGDFLVCWHVDYVSKALTKFEGDRISSQAFTIRKEFDKNKAGQLSSVLANEILLNVGGNSFIFKKIANGATLSEGVIAMLPPEARAITLRAQYFPLTFADRQRIKAALAASVIVPMIEAVLSAPNDARVVSRFQRAQLAEVVDNQIGTLFASLNPADHPLAEELAQQILLSTPMTHDGATRPVLEFLQDITFTSEQSATGPIGQMEQLEQHLKLVKQSTTTHFYSFDLTMAGASGDFFVSLGGFIGQLNITDIDDPIARNVLRTIGSFTAVMAQAGGGPGIGANLGFNTTGTGVSPYVWLARHFPGSFTMADAGFGVSVPLPITSGFSFASAMFLRGNGEFPEMIVDFGGPSSQFGFAISGSVTEALGQVFSDPQSQDAAVLGSHRVDQDYTVANHLEADIHFDFGSAVLTPSAREALRIFCANELSALSSTGSQLTISAQADRVDTDQRNLALSKMRAQNTLQAIQDIVGGRLALPAGRMVTRGLGEQGAKEAGDADQTKNPARRKSEVVLNSRLVATLFGRK